MANKEQYLDRNGVSHFYLLIKEKLTAFFKTLFVIQKDGYGLSQNDFTNELKARLENIDTSNDYGDISGKFDSNGVLKTEYLPDLGFYDDVTEGYFNEDDANFYAQKNWIVDEEHTEGYWSYVNQCDKDKGKIYIDLDTNLSYRWGGSVYVKLESSTGFSALTNEEINEIIDSVEQATK